MTASTTSSFAEPVQKEVPSSLKISNLSVEYMTRTNKVLALDNVSLEIPSRGYTIGIVGESGSGKTTLGLAIMNAIEPPGRISAGSILYGDKDVLRMSKEQLRRYRWEHVAMVYQSAMNSLNPVKRAGAHLTEALREHTDGALSRDEARQRAISLLADVSINKDRAFDYPHELSGGMRQRVIIALALMLSPKFLIADEPTSALDVVTQKQLLTLLKERVTRDRLSLIFITHEISVLNGLVDTVGVMYLGEVVEKGPIDKVLAEPLHPYTEMLLSTLLTLDSDKSSLLETARTGVRGAMAARETRMMGSGNYCKYSNRCKYVFERCKVERPKLLQVQNDRWVACHKFSK
jgi:peptide/nickel transport system ATP-binding protein